MSGTRRTSLSLRFIVIGGGISGLSCAYALQAAGHSVLVLEQSDGKIRSHSGVRCPPNMTRILRKWGLGPALAQMGTKCSKFNFLLAETGETVGQLELHDQLIKALQADFIFMQHGDLQSLIYDLATKAGVEFNFQSKVVSVDPQHAAVVLENGTKVSGDILIGADGYESIIQSVVLGPGTFPGTQDKWMFFNFSVSTELMHKDDELRPLTESTEWSIWLGVNYSANGFLMHGKHEYAICFVLPAQGGQFSENWNQQISMDDLNLSVQCFEPRIRKLMALSGKITPTKFVVRESFDSWVHDEAKVLLCGDAAHPSMPNATHNAALALEDAATLGNLFSRLYHRDQIPIILSAYEELRQPRCNKIQKSEVQTLDFLPLPNGPELRLRDEGMRGAMAMAFCNWDETDMDYLKGLWEEYVQVFVYDADEAVDDWWAKRGGLISRGSGPKYNVKVLSERTVEYRPIDS